MKLNQRNSHCKQKKIIILMNKILLPSADIDENFVQLRLFGPFVCSKKKKKSNYVSQKWAGTNQTANYFIHKF